MKVLLCNIFSNSILILNILLCQSILAQNIKWKPAQGHIMTKWANDVTPNNVWREYPRPQLQRGKWLNLNGLWDYAIRPKEKGAPQKYDGKILVPFPVESALSGIGKKVGERNKIWYRRKFVVPKDWSAKRIIIRFEAVDWETQVWINGKSAGTNKGGYERISFDIKPYLKKSGKQEVVVSVWDPTDAGTQPRGKQVQKPGGIMYTSVTGIWQTVWLEPLPAANIEVLKIIPDIDKNSANISAICVNVNKYFKMKAMVFDHGEKISEGIIEIAKSKEILVPNAKLWSPDSPFLYDLKILLYDEEGNPIDSVSSYFGMRKISLGKDENGITRIMLNNKFIFQFGLLDQGWWPDGLYTAPTDEALRYDIEMTKKMGFNLARKHVKVETERWYYWCDKLGLLVWQDMPSGDKGISPIEPDISKTIESSLQFELELNQMVNWHINHPSIVVWILYNEGWGQWKTKELTKEIASWDQSRLIDDASGWADRGVGDIHDIHSYPGPAMPDLEENRALVLGEFGGLGLPLKSHTWIDQGNWGYLRYNNTKELQDAYTILVDSLMYLKNRGLSAAVYTQTTDVESEVNGLMTYDRKVTKIDPDVLTKINSGFLPPVFDSEGNMFVDSIVVVLNNVAPSGEIHYTTDGSMPGIESPLYNKLFILYKTTTVKAAAFWNNQSFSDVKERKFEKVIERPSENKINLEKGLKYFYYENNGIRWSVLPDWNVLKPTNKGIIPAIILLPNKNREYDFGYVYDGYIKIEQSGIYTFYLESDDGSQLFIGDKLVIDNNGVHGMQEKAGKIALKAGFQPIRVNYFQGTGEKGIELRYKGPGFSKQLIFPEVLFHAN